MDKFNQTEIGMAPEGWSEVKLSDIVEIIGGGTPKTNVSEYWGGDIPWLSVVDFNNDLRRVYTSEKTITQKGLKNSSTRILKKGDLIISARGTVGVIAQLGADMAFNQSCYGLRAKQTTTNDFVYYALKYSVNKLKNSAHGSVFDTITRNTFELIDVLFPPISEQRIIASILGSLDDKIELNRKMNTTLEKIGQALFKHWFVDFEFPNEEGKPYRSSGGEMVETELGEVPKGWRVGTLGDICEITMGQSPPGETYNEIGDGLPFYQGISDFGFRFPSRRVYCTAPTRFAEEGDVLLSVRAPVGIFNIADERCAIGRGVAALRLKGKHSGYLYYLLHATQIGWNKFEAEGTVFGSVTKSDVHDFKVILPPETLRNWFGSLVETLDKQITINEKQSRTLAAIRDALLPKLMSGEIRVKVG